MAEHSVSAIRSWLTNRRRATAMEPVIRTFAALHLAGVTVRVFVSEYRHDWRVEETQTRPVRAPTCRTHYTLAHGGHPRGEERTMEFTNGVIVAVLGEPWQLARQTRLDCEIGDMHRQVFVLTVDGERSEFESADGLLDRALALIAPDCGVPTGLARAGPRPEDVLGVLRALRDAALDPRQDAVTRLVRGLPLTNLF